jgi:hypothetical protein
VSISAPCGVGSGLDIVAPPPRVIGAGAVIVFTSAFPDRNCQAVSAKIPLTDRPSARADAATAGGQLIGAIVACAAAGYGLGTLVGLAVPLGLAGVFAGLIAGMALVYVRYRRI